MKRGNLFLIGLASISFVLLLPGCGQSGPLYIPGDPSQMAVPPTNETSETSETDEEQEESHSSAPE